MARSFCGKSWALLVMIKRDGGEEERGSRRYREKDALMERKQTRTCGKKCIFFGSPSSTATDPLPLSFAPRTASILASTNYPDSVSINLGTTSLSSNMSTNSYKYSVILPTYQERRNLPIVIWLLARTFTEQRLEWEVIVVDDASPDGTLEVAKELQAVYGENRIVRRRYLP